ncbi:MAG: prephenate dehydrogenase/arogenate dehydrogenase family protein [Gammaproteobacteria bacterium]|nr:prephenate dehydrogenase/arogenate dehydrogenase family protein [Gammaproteobacteria bacterium]
MAELLIKRLCIVGVGLIGGSLARALREAGVVTEIIGTGRNIENLKKAVALGVIDSYEEDLARAVKGADVVVVAVPLGAMEAVFKTIAPHLDEHAILTDVGSAKGSVVKAAENAFGSLPVNLVPGHPIAGTEQSGVEASFAELYNERRIIITPTSVSDAQAIARVRAMWEACGAEVVEMNVEHHDEVLAATSHLPHMLAYTLVDTLARMDDSQEIFDYAAGGFRDFTRIASSDPQMWNDICLANHDALVVMLERFSADLKDLSNAVQRNDGDYLKEMFTRAKQARDAFCNK